MKGYQTLLTTDDLEGVLEEMAKIRAEVKELRQMVLDLLVVDMFKGPTKDCSGPCCDIDQLEIK